MMLCVMTLSISMQPLSPEVALRAAMGVPPHADADKKEQKARKRKKPAKG